MEQKDSVVVRILETLLGDGGGRYVRGFFYFLTSFFLVKLNTYGLHSAYLLPIAIGILGMGSSAARIARIPLVILVVMAAVPLASIQAIRAVFP